MASHERASDHRSADQIPAVSVRGLVSGYGRQRVLHGVDLELAPGQAVGLIGANGAGKSTTAHCIVGNQPVWAGAVSFGSIDVAATSTRELLQNGLRLVPQDGGTFGKLSVRQNLELGARGVSVDVRDEAIDESLEVFPDLKAKLDQRAGALSGGQRQMLAVGMAMCGRPRVLILDEPSLGLAPSLCESLLESIDELRRATGLTVLLIEQNVQLALPRIDRALIMSNGRIVHETDPSDIDVETLWKFF